MGNALSDKPENYFTIHQLPILLLYGLGTTVSYKMDSFIDAFCVTQCKDVWFYYWLSTRRINSITYDLDLYLYLVPTNNYLLWCRKKPWVAITWASIWLMPQSITLWHNNPGRTRKKKYHQWCQRSRITSSKFKDMPWGTILRHHCKFMVIVDLLQYSWSENYCYRDKNSFEAVYGLSYNISSECSYLLNCHFMRMLNLSSCICLMQGCFLSCL